MKKQLCALFAVALAGLAISAGIPNQVLAYDNESDVTFDSGNYEEILFVPYGKSESEVFYDSSLNDREGYGPNAFFVDDETIYVMDSLNNQIKEYKNGTFVDSICLEKNNPVSLFSSFVVNDKIYACNSDNGKNSIYTFSLDGKKEAETSFTSLPVMSMNIQKDSLFVYDGQAEYEFELIKGVPVFKSKNPYKKQSVGENVMSYYIAENDKYSFETSISIEDDTCLNGEFSIIAFDKQGDKNIQVPLPIDKYYYRIDSYFTTDNEKNYLMIPESDGIRIYSINFDSGSDFSICGNRNYVIADDNNDNDLLASSISLSRQQVLSRANTIAGCDWTLRKINTISSSSYITLPDYVNAKVLSGVLENGGTAIMDGIPYCWGGFDSQDTSNTTGYTNFVSAISAGRIAGNINSSSSGKVSGTCGLDCSGFVSAAYKLGEKKATWELATFGNAVNYSQLNTMDFLVKSSVHTLLFYNWQSTDHSTMLIMESNNPANYDDKTLIRIVNTANYVNNGYSARTPFN